MAMPTETMQAVEIGSGRWGKARLWVFYAAKSCWMPQAWMTMPSLWLSVVRYPSPTSRTGVETVASMYRWVNLQGRRERRFGEMEISTNGSDVLPGGGRERLHGLGDGWRDIGSIIGC